MGPVEHSPLFDRAFSISVPRFSWASFSEASVVRSNRAMSPTVS